MDNKKKRNKRRNRQNKNKNKTVANESASKSNDQTIIIPDKCQNGPLNVPSSSPRPNTLSRGNCETVVKRSSGSEYEDFQTPSIEYDIKNEECNDNSEDLYSNSCDKEWNEMMSFGNRDLENIDERDMKVHRQRIQFVETKESCWKNFIEDTEPVKICKINFQEQDLDIEENVEAVEHQLLVEDDFSLDKEEESVNNECCNNERDIKVLRQRIHFVETKESCCKNFIEDTEPVKTCEINSQEQDIEENVEAVEHQALVEDDFHLDKEEDSVNNESCINCVDQFFRDLDDECTQYPLKEKEEATTETTIEIEEEEYHRNRLQEVVDDILETKDDDQTIEDPNVPLKDDREIQVEDHGLEDKETEEVMVLGDDIFDLMCTEENLTEETLSVKCIKLDVTSESFVQRSMTLRPRTVESTFNESEESSKYVISRSDDNIPISIKKERPPKKNKFTETNLYLKLFKRFRKEKSPEKEEVRIESFEHNLSLKSGDVVKDSEIESNQSLISNNDFANTSQIFTPTFEAEPSEQVVTQDVVTNVPEVPEGQEKQQTPTSIKKRIKTNKSERPRSFLNILKIKNKTKKEPETKDSDHLQLESKVEEPPLTPDAVNLSVTEKTEETPIRNAEISKEVMDDFQDALKSLMDSGMEYREDKIVFVKERVDEIILTPVHDPVTNTGPADNEDNDYLFPDAVTATKIIGVMSKEVPYIDDPAVTQSDSKSFYNGESKRLRISPEFFVPMASMESLFFPEDSITNNEFQKSLLPQSPCKRKRVLGTLLGYMGRAR